MRFLFVFLLCIHLAAPALAAESRIPPSGARHVAESTSVVHGNAKSRIYHNASCRYFNCKACTVVFKSAAQARAGGFRPCKICGG